MLVKQLESDFKPLLSTLDRDFCVTVSFVICTNTKYISIQIPANIIVL